jgi:hypothetical protein
MNKVYDFPISHNEWPKHSYDDPFINMKFNNKKIAIPQGMRGFFIVRDYKSEDMVLLRSIYEARRIRFLVKDSGVKKPRKKIDYAKMLECWDILFGNQNNR